MDLKQLTDKATKLHDEIDGLIGKREKVEEEKAKADLDKQIEGKNAELDGALEQIEQAKAQAARKAAIDAAKKDLEPEPKGDLGEGEAKNKPAGKAKDLVREAREKEKAFFGYVHAGFSATDGERAKALAPTSKKFKDGADGVVVPNRMAAKIFGPRWAKAMEMSDEIERAKLMQSDDSGDSSLIPEDYRASLLELAPEPGHVLGRVTIVPAPTGAVVWPHLVQSDSDEYGGVSFSWIDEGGSKPETEPEFGQKAIQTHECAGYTEVTQRMLDRSALSVEQILTRLYRSAAQDEINGKILTGSGTGEPQGAINAAGIRTVARATAGEVGWDDLVDLKHALRPYHRAGAVYLIEDSVEQHLEKQTDSQNRPLFNNTVQGGPYDRLAGYPYEVSTRLSSLGEDGDVVYADWREYIVGMEQEVVIKRSEHFRFRTSRVAFAIYFVLGGDVVQPRVFAILQGAES